jgi:hypothetical protein
MKRTVDPELAKNLPPVLVVEGGTDYQYIKALNWLFRRQVAEGSTKRVTLDCELLAANGSAGIGPSALFEQQIGHTVVVLYDNEPDAKKHAEELKKQLFPEGQILFIDADGKPDCDIEDMFPERFYLDAVNEVYRVILKSSKFAIIEKRDLKAFRQKNTAITRIVPVLKSIWASHKADGWGAFDKTAVCERICLDILQTKKVDEHILGGFQKLFERIAAATATTKTTKPTVPLQQHAPPGSSTTTISVQPTQASKSV